MAIFVVLKQKINWGSRIKVISWQKSQNKLFIRSLIFGQIVQYTISIDLNKPIYLVEGWFYKTVGNSADPDQAASWSSLIWVYTVCSGTTVQINRLNTIFPDYLSLIYDILLHAGK